MEDSMMPVRRGENVPNLNAQKHLRKFRTGVGPDLLWDRNYTYEQFEKMKLSSLAYDDLNLSTLVELLRTNFRVEDKQTGDPKKAYDPVKNELKKMFKHPFIGRKLIAQRQDVLGELLMNDELLEGISDGLELLSQSEKAKRDANVSYRDDYGCQRTKADEHKLLDATKKRIEAYRGLREALESAESERLREAFDYIDAIVTDERFVEVEELIGRMDDGSYTFRLEYVTDDYPRITLYKNPSSGLDADKAKLTMQNSLSEAIADAFYRAIVGFADGILSYVKDENFKHSLDAYRALATHLKELEKRGLKFCKPEILPKSKRVMIVEEAVNPLLAESKIIVPNDINHDPQTNVFVLTGSNNGGKTTYIKTVGLLQVLAEAGLYVPAKRAVISQVDNIYTHFVTADDVTKGEGRYRNELRRLREIFENATPFSLALIDEPCGGTSVKEGGEQSLHILDGFHKIGCPTYFSTHIHEVANEVDNNGRYPGAKNLQVEVHENGNGLEFTYRIIPGKAGKSYAVEVAEKYDMGPSHIKEIIRVRVKRGELKERQMR